MEHARFCPGLRGVIAGETEICRIDGGLQYRGYCLQDLAESSGYLEVAYLLLFDDLPTEEHFFDFLSILTEEQSLPPLIQQVFEQLPTHTSPLAAMRTGLALLSHFDPQPHVDLLQAGTDQALRIIARMPLLLGLWQRCRRGLEPLLPRPELSYVGNIFYQIKGEAPSALQERSLEVALLVAMEHEFTTSSFTARCVGSTGANLYGAILAALEAFIGHQHGGGDDAALDLIAEVRVPQRAELWAAELAPDLELPGFGHPVYTDCDPRAAVLELIADRLARSTGRGDLEELCDAIERAIWQERRLPPNIDWPWCRVLSYLGLPRDVFRALFAVARCVGWAAHALEQSECPGPIRPRARYRGATDCLYEPMRFRLI